jgi:hypothetical protein
MWFIWIFPVIGAVLLVVAGVMVSRTMAFLRSGTPGVAQVVAYDARPGSKGGTLYAPVLRLLEPTPGFEQTSSTASSDRKWKIGTKVRVKCDPADPAKFQIDSPDDAFTGAAICGVIGAVFLIMGLVFLFIFNGPKDEVIWEPEHDIPYEQLEEATS